MELENKVVHGRSQTISFWTFLKTSKETGNLFQDPFSFVIVSKKRTGFNQKQKVTFFNDF